MKIEAKPWPDVVEFYSNLVTKYGWPLEPMLELVRRIEASPYACGLVAYNAHATLIIAQSEKNFWKGPELRIEFSPEKQFVFTFIEREDVKSPWVRTASADESFEVLERFLTKRARWLRKPGAAGDQSTNIGPGLE